MSFLLNPYVNASRSQFYANFDGVNDYLSKTGGLDNATDGTGFSCVFWWDYTPSLGDSYSIFNLGGRITIEAVSNRTLELRAYDSSGTNILQFSAGNFFYSGCFFISWNQGVGTVKVYRESANYSGAASNNDLANIDISNTGDVLVGNGVHGHLLGDIYNFWADDQYIDFSIEANRRKFLTADGKAEHLAVDGSAPTGSAPLIYLNGYGNFENNGRGGAFVTNGALTQGGAAPL